MCPLYVTFLTCVHCTLLFLTLDIIADREVQAFGTHNNLVKEDEISNLAKVVKPSKRGKMMNKYGDESVGSNVNKIKVINEKQTRRHGKKRKVFSKHLMNSHSVTEDPSSKLDEALEPRKPSKQASQIEDSNLVNDDVTNGKLVDDLESRKLDENMKPPDRDSNQENKVRDMEREENIEARTYGVKSIDKSNSLEKVSRKELLEKELGRQSHGKSVKNFIKSKKDQLVEAGRDRELEEEIEGII